MLSNPIIDKTKSNGMKERFHAITIGSSKSLYANALGSNPNKTIDQYTKNPISVTNIDNLNDFPIIASLEFRPENK